MIGDLDTDETKTAKNKKEIKHTIIREGGIDLITSKDFDHPLAKSELIKSEVKTLVKSETIEMKTDLKTEIKQENFGEFEARKKVGIDLPFC